jgi:hypothetical protein
VGAPCSISQVGSARAMLVRNAKPLYEVHAVLVGVSGARFQRASILELASAPISIRMSANAEGWE